MINHMNFNEAKLDFDIKYSNSDTYNCFLTDHLTANKKNQLQKEKWC